MKKLLILFTLAFALSGCASTQVSQGMSKEQVELAWGNPNSIRTSENSCCKEKNQEVWHYFGKGLHISKPDRSVMFEDEVVRFIF